MSSARRVSDGGECNGVSLAYALANDTAVSDPGFNQFANPTGIFVDRAGRIYVADSRNNRIVRMER